MYDVHQLHVIFLMLFLFHSEEAAGFSSSFVLYYKQNGLLMKFTVLFSFYYDLQKSDL